jgi:hypothetical protein
MPCAFSIPGLHHIIDNLTKALHTKLGYWSSFKAMLDNLESFLTKRELVDTFIWSCLRERENDASEAALAKTLRLWNYTLYEKRWFEIVRFVAHLNPVLSGLRAAWSAGRFADAATDETKHRSESNNVKFDQTLLTTTLHSGLFAKYLEFIISIEQLTHRLEGWADGCPCHAALFEFAANDLPTSGRFQSFRSACIRRHYGRDITVCPMNGLNAPELVAGKALELLQSLCDISFANLISDAAAPGAMPLTDEDRQTLAQDIATARAHLQLELQTKLDWTQRLPWLLLALAHVHEPTARLMGRRALEEFERDPRKTAHHRITWAWFKPGSRLWTAFHAFIFENRSRSSLPGVFLNSVASARFVPIVETTIEAKHKAVAMESIRGMGPVRVSLSNRLPLLERHVRDDPRYLLRLVECFEEARQFKQIPMLLGLADHPSLQHLRRMRSSDLVQVLTRIIYRCDVYDVCHHKAEIAWQHD